MNYLLVNLALADIMVALFIAPQFILIHTFKHPDGMTGSLFCKLLTGGSLTWIGAAASAFTLVVIAFERYYAVMYPHSNKGKMTNNKLKVSMITIYRVRSNGRVQKYSKQQYRFTTYPFTLVQDRPSPRYGARITKRLNFPS